jgi:Domain of unknown function (DUF222)
VVDDGEVLDTQLDPRQTIIACLGQWRAAIVGCDDAGLPAQVRDIEAVSRMLHAVMLETVAELDSRNLAATSGFGSTKRLLAGMLQLSATEAGTRVAHATQLATRRTLSGEVLPPVLAKTAAELAAREIGVGQVRVIAETMAAVPASVGIEQREAAEADLARYARSFNPISLLTRSRCPRSGGTFWRTWTRMVPSPDRSPSLPLLRGNCGCGSAVMGGWGSRGSWSLSMVPRSVL